MIRMGYLQRWDAVGRFACDAQGFAAAGKDFQFGTGTQKIFADLRAGFDEMLAVIENYQDSFRAQLINKDFERGTTTIIAQVENRK